ncbi:MAG: sulfite oxidase [Nocardioidaceae bacterium]
MDTAALNPSTRSKDRPALSRRAALRIGAAGAGVAAGVIGSSRALAIKAFGGSIVKPLPRRWFHDYGSNAEMRWDSVLPRYLTPTPRLFVRDHTATPRIDARSYALEIFGDGLRRPRGADDPVTLSYERLRSLPARTVVSLVECTGNGRAFFGTQQGTPADGTPWTLGGVGVVRWRGVPLAHVLNEVGRSADAVDIMATGLDDPYVSDGVDHGRVRRPFPVAKALDDALLAYEANGESLPPDHGFPVRLLLPGWVGIANIKWLGSLEVSAQRLESPWNTTWYRMTGDAYPDDSPPLTVLPVKSALELPWDARLPRRRTLLTGRSWTGAGRITRVQLSTDGGRRWHDARLTGQCGQGWTPWEYDWRPRRRGAYEILARASDSEGRTQPRRVPFNDGGYFFWAVVRHPVTVV